MLDIKICRNILTTKGNLSSCIFQYTLVQHDLSTVHKTSFSFLIASITATPLKAIPMLAKSYSFY